MELSEYNFPKVDKIDIAFPTFNTIPELLEEAQKRDLTKGRKMFNTLFYTGGKVEFQDDVKGTWKEKAWFYCRALMGSFEPKHQDKEAVCAMLMQECLKL
jgi:hypothetical protein